MLPRTLQESGPDQPQGEAGAEEDGGLPACKGLDAVSDIPDIPLAQLLREPLELRGSAVDVIRYPGVVLFTKLLRRLADGAGHASKSRGQPILLAVQLHGSLLTHQFADAAVMARTVAAAGACCVTAALDPGRGPLSAPGELVAMRWRGVYLIDAGAAS
jgi:hypothetical protein